MLSVVICLPLCVCEGSVPGPLWVTTCVDTQVPCTNGIAFASNLHASSLTLENYLWMYPAKAMPIAVALCSLRNNDNRVWTYLTQIKYFLKHFESVVDWIHRCKSHRDTGLGVCIVDQGGNTNDQNLLHKKDKIQIH